MFTKNIVGTANGLAVGCGQIGVYVAIRGMSDIIFPLFLDHTSDAETAWRSAPVVPATITLISALIIFFISDDTPKGNFSELRGHGSLDVVSVDEYWKLACRALGNAWVLVLQFAACYGGLWAVVHWAPLHFIFEFEFSLPEAERVQSVALFLPALTYLLGGVTSDFANAKLGMRGRLLVQTILLFFTGITTLAFSRISSVTGAKTAHFFIMIFGPAAQASTFAIAPYVCVPTAGLVMGMVGAGGHLGGLGFEHAFVDMEHDFVNMEYQSAFTLVGILVTVSSCFSVFIKIEGHSSLLSGKENVSESPEGVEAKDETQGETNEEVPDVSPVNDTFTPFVTEEDEIMA